MRATPRLRPVPSILAAAGLALAALLAAAPAASAGAKGFAYGVAAGDVTDSSAILWAKAEKQGEALVQVTRKGGFGDCDIKGAKGKLIAKAKSSNDLTVEKKVKKLDPGESYKYRFCMKGGKHSATGKFTTAPDPKQKKTVEFALTGDQDARTEPGQPNPYWNNFEVWDAIRRQGNDFNVLMGDTIYSDTEVPGYGLADVALTKQQKWDAYKTNLAMKPWQKARGAAAYYGTWDDHEFINDFSPFEDSFPLGVGTVNIDGEELHERGVDAFRDYTPSGYKSKTGAYRHFRWGKNVEIFILDERSFRSASADYQGGCDNPSGSGDPDLAPTAPEFTRNTFEPLVPQFANPPSQACLDAIDDPNRTMLGAKQLQTFKQDVKKSKATFKVIFNEVPIQQYYALPYDRWEGYEAERQELLTFLRDNVKNAVFLTTDVHANLVGEARFCTLEAGCPQDSGITEVTTGPIATAPYALEVSDAIGNPFGGVLVHDAFLKPQPPNGIGMQCAAMDQFSYAQVRVSKSELRVDLLDASDQPVLDTADRNDAAATPCAPIVIPKE